MRLRKYFVFALVICSGLMHAQLTIIGNDGVITRSDDKKDTTQAKKDTPPLRKDTIKDEVSPYSSSKIIAAARDTARPRPESTFDPGKTSLGLGLGLDYGGLIGANFTLYPQKNVGIFGGVGYAFIGLGYNVGVKLRYISKNPYYRINPFIEYMYGYNAVIHVSNAEELSKMFYGTTLGFGFDIQRRERGGFSMALLIPFRENAVADYENMLQTKYHATITQELLPIAFSIGYKWYFN